MAFISNSLSRANGGMFDAMRLLALAMKEQNRYEPAALGLRDAESEHDLAQWDGVQTKVFGASGPKAFGYAPALLDALRKSGSDIAHTHGLWMYPSVATTAWAGARRPFVVSPHGMLDRWALDHSRMKKRISAALYEDRHLRRAACIHALTQAEANAVRSYGLTNPICVIPNGVSLPTHVERRAERRSRTLFYLGRLHPKKGLRLLIEAWAMIEKEARDQGWQLAIAGWDQGKHRDELESLAARLDVRSSVCFDGPVFGSQKDERFSEVDGFVLPSLSEGLPMAILEAWSWKLPVLMTPACNLPEGAETGAAVMMNADVDSIAQALRRLMAMSDLERDCMGENGYALVAQKFQWSTAARQMADVYDWALGRGARPACVLN